MTAPTSYPWEFAALDVTADEQAALLALLDQLRTETPERAARRPHRNVPRWWDEGNAFVKTDWPDGSATLHVRRINLRVLPELLTDHLGRPEDDGPADAALRSLAGRLAQHCAHQLSVRLAADSRARRTRPDDVVTLHAGPRPLSDPREHALWRIPAGQPDGEDMVQVYADAVDGVSVTAARGVLRTLTPEQAERIAGALAGAAEVVRGMRELAEVAAARQGVRS